MSMRTTVVLSIILCALGCESKQEEVPAAPATPTPAAAPTPSPTPADTAAAQTGPDLKVAQGAAQLANQIEQAPGDAEKILTTAGTSREQFLETLYTIAQDPHLSAEYARLYEPKQAG
jgi:hypothetical protein